MPTFDKIATCPYGTNAFKVCEKEMLIKYKWLILMIVLTKIKEHNQKCQYIPDHPYRILVIGDSWSGKTIALLNLINNQPDINKICLCAKDPYKAKYQCLINKLESTGLKHFNDPKAFVEYSNDMQDVYKNIEEYNLGKKRKILSFWWYDCWYD